MACVPFSWTNSLKFLNAECPSNPILGARLDVGLTEQEKQAMLEKHNALKRAPYPKNPGVIGKNMKGYVSKARKIITW